MKGFLVFIGAVGFILLLVYFTSAPPEETTAVAEKASNELVDVFPNQQEVETFLQQFGDYGLHREEALVYVVNKSDNRHVTGGHHQLRLQGGQLLGKLGAIEEILIDASTAEFKAESGADGLELRETREHERMLKFLGDRYRIEREGAMTYLLYNGKRVTSGHHKLYIEATHVFGQIGAQTEMIWDWTKAPHL